MKKPILIILFLCTYYMGYSQAPISQVSFNTITELRLQKGSGTTEILLNGLNAINDGAGGLYMWNATSTVSDDGYNTIQVTGVTTGRWIRLNLLPKKISALLSGVLLQTAYTVTFPVAYSFTPASIIIIPKSTNAALPSWISAITTSNFVVNFNSALIVGTNNIAFDYIVVNP